MGSTCNFNMLFSMVNTVVNSFSQGAVYLEFIYSDLCPLILKVCHSAYQYFMLLLPNLSSKWKSVSHFRVTPLLLPLIFAHFYFCLQIQLKCVGVNAMSGGSPLFQVAAKFPTPPKHAFIFSPRIWEMLSLVCVQFPHVIGFIYGFLFSSIDLWLLLFICLSYF